MVEQRCADRYTTFMSWLRVVPIGTTLPTHLVMPRALPAVILMQPLRGSIRHYHDNTNLEADLIISLDNGKWAAVEVKLESSEIEEGAEHLKTLAAKIDTERFLAPSFLMILTGGEFAYRRDDGVYIVSLGCLKD